MSILTRESSDYKPATESSGNQGWGQYLSCNPALVPAAVDAVKKWKYAPIYLNGESVEIKTQIDLPFTLHQ